MTTTAQNQLFRSPIKSRKTGKRAKSDLERGIAEYLSKGGKIHKCPPAGSDFTRQACAGVE
ncbi:hypothetical protein NFC81_09195 [Salinispirillum sp. LH 10-3-1]|uniref:Uncharacterized protein n=1 Tax=Salinispirillum sp. LH 10-3-1 TaxID=2952525 RepID=A0AB38YC11_9GAMM